MTKCRSTPGRVVLVVGLLASIVVHGASTALAQVGAMSVNADARWDDRFSGWPNSTAATTCLARDGSGNLYAGSGSAIGKWNGATWSAVGTGLVSNVYALATDAGGNLYVGGSFTYAGDVNAARMARWNGTTWSSLGLGLNSWVNAVAVDGNGNVYAAGEFVTAGGAPAAHIARWNGSSWSALGAGLSDRAYALAIDGDGNVYAAGDFTTAGGGRRPTSPSGTVPRGPPSARD